MSSRQNLKPIDRAPLSEQPLGAPLRQPKEVPTPAAEPASRSEKAAPEARAPAEVAREQRQQEAPHKKGRFGVPRRFVLGAIALVALIAAGVWGHHYWTVGRFMVSTDDAYVGANMAQLSARVAARVAEVPMEANQTVTKGTPLVILDDGDYRLAVEQAKARLATQQSTIDRIGRQIDAGRAAVTQAIAQRDAADADLVRAEADFDRTQHLAQNQYSSRAALDAARATRDRAVATQASARAGVTAAETNVSVLEGQKTEAERASAELKVAVEKAERDLDGTVIRAPFDGIIGNKSVQVGDYVTVGKRLAAVVPLDDVYVDANFKETQLAGLHAGSRAHVTIDAADGAGFDGTVRSIAPASGSQFSLLPPENATGNFTKIVQRVPVRIAVPRRMIEQGVLRPGLSVVVSVDTRKGQKQAGTSGRVE